MMGTLIKDNSIEQMKSDNSNSLNCFNEDQTRRNVSRIVKALDKDGLRNRVSLS